MIAENCPHCPRCLKSEGENKEGDCYDPAKEEGSDKKERSEFDKYHAALAYMYYSLAGFDIVGVLGCSKSGTDAYIENNMLEKCMFKSGELPDAVACMHPSWSLRKVSDLLKRVSMPAPLANTRPKIAKEGKKKNDASIGRKEELLLAYKLAEPYFDALIKLTESETTKTILFGILESSDTYRPMFALKYANIILDQAYISLSPFIVSMAMNASSVAKGKNKVLFTLGLTTRLILPRFQRRKICD